jgi:hypothetical protein
VDADMEGWGKLSVRGVKDGSDDFPAGD